MADWVIVFANLTTFGGNLPYVYFDIEQQLLLSYLQSKHSVVFEQLLNGFLINHGIFSEVQTFGRLWLLPVAVHWGRQESPGLRGKRYPQPIKQQSIGPTPFRQPGCLWPKVRVSLWKSTLGRLRSISQHSTITYIQTVFCLFMGRFFSRSTH